MTIESRIHSLRKKHDELEAEISREAGRPGGDDTKISKLKKEKLLINDQIEALNRK